ncbi:uncharacterized protein PFL1_00613 [Pseudozyma flocculosa PF-1]|uniref:Related to transesterase n=1 Tax=Pseudozyma flocculosa TaxID=84751 RepID=A0A5C3ER96_9BASI|nr:uncharacterized protein PFL1_00613 [Pseudozyma flocculosa PF-1]EPQ32417.1 hypothetical protein PFL1_00613 [Pseudozyma flocculosa PF-1]SPO34602.1 related to transesterase [Pseudozyma flocculosa]
MTSAQAVAQAFVDQLVGQSSFPGAAVWAGDRNGTIAHAAAGKLSPSSGKDVTTETPFWIASCTKLVTVIALLQLVEQGKVDLDSPADKYVPGITKLQVIEADGSLRPPKRQPTVRELASHTSGQTYPFFNEAVDAYCAKNGIDAFGCAKSSIEAPMIADPGTRWEYGSSIDWCGQIVEAVSGQDLDGYFKEHIFKPLGIKGMTFKPQTGGLLAPKSGTTYRDPADGSIHEIPHPLQQDESKIEVQYGGAGLYASAGEYGQILVALLNRGTHPKGGQILKPETVELLFEEQLSAELVKDLDRPVMATQPKVTNPFSILPGFEKQWCFGGCVANNLPNGRGRGIWWAGIMNHYWFISLDRGTCGMVQVNQYPFFLEPVVVPFFFDFEPKIHNIVDPRKEE